MKVDLIFSFLIILSLANAHYPESTELLFDKVIVSNQETKVNCRGRSERSSVYNNHKWTAKIPGASWIWKDTNRGDPMICRFSTEFYIYPGLDNALLEIAGDDRYITFVNKKNAYCSCHNSCWLNSNIKRCFVENLIGMGDNKMEILVKNEDGLAGLTFKLSLFY